MRAAVVALILICAGAYLAGSDRAGSYTALPGADGRLRYDGYDIEALRQYDMEVLVLSRRAYRRDREADLSPVDLALGWGPMAQPENAAAISVSQRNRWYFWRAETLPLSARTIASHTANVHIIPATPAVREMLYALDPDQHLRLTGKLVEVRGRDGWRWRSSLSFDDTGRGACEVLWLEHVEVI